MTWGAAGVQAVKAPLILRSSRVSKVLQIATTSPVKSIFFGIAVANITQFPYKDANFLPSEARSFWNGVTFMQRTFSIIKPDAVRKNVIGDILNRVERAGLRIIAMRKMHLTRAEAEAIYAVHKGLPFFGDLIDFMTSGPVVVAVLEGKNGVAVYREVMGATDPAKAAPGTIRADHAETMARNAVHGSDSVESARYEMGCVFTQEDLGVVIPDQHAA